MSSRVNCRRLGDMAMVVMGQAPPGKDCNKTGQGMPFVKAGEFKDRFPAVVEWTTNPQKIARIGDVLLCVVGATAGKLNEGIDCAIGRSLAAIRPDSSKLVSSYLYRFLQTQVLRLRAQSQGLAQGVITREMIQQILLPTPSVSEQRRIADILDKADALRTKRRAAIAQLEALTLSIFLDMFGDPTTNPRGWRILKIGDLLESAAYGTSEKARASGEFAVLRMNNITRAGDIDLTDLKYMELSGEDRERYIVKAGDVLFNRTNSAELVGKTAIYRRQDRMAFAGYLIRLRVNESNDPEYLSAYLNTGYSKRILRGMCKSIIGMANINATQIQAMRIPQPPLALQRQFAKCVSQIEKAKVVQRAWLDTGDSLFSSLQARAFQGGL